MDSATDNYTNILTVSGKEHQTQNVTCQAEYGSGLILASNQLIIEGFTDRVSSRKRYLGGKKEGVVEF